MYVHKESQQTKRLSRLINALKGFSKADIESNEAFDSIQQEMIDSFKYIKPYSGNWQRGERHPKKITFYNEREWRYSPLLNQHAVLSADFEGNKVEKKRINDELKKDIIKFEVKDVKFIVIKSKKDIAIVAEVIDKISGISDLEKNELITKIISFEEIREDFG
jgi:hypothetical protein